MQQITFSLENNALDEPLHNYIEARSNSHAHKIIQAWPSKWGVEPYPRTLIIQGPPSCGKTYLANIWARNSHAIFIKKEHVLTESILLTHNQFIIENIDDRWDEEKLLHCFNSINENKKYLLLTRTKTTPFALPDLESRIKAAYQVNIEKPDDELMQVLIFKLFSSYAVVVKPEVIEYILKVFPREFTKIIEYTKQINELALATQRKITIPLIKEALNENVKNSNSLKKIIR